MSEQSYTCVAVAVPHGGIDSALRFAAREALVRGCPAVAVGPDPEVLADAAAEIEVLAGPGVPVDVRVAPDGDAEAALAACPDASLLVVHRSNVLHLLHALSYGEAGTRTTAAIACVPENWWPRHDDRRPVVVGVDDAFHAETLLSAGLREAQRHDTTLVAVHAWELPCRLGPEKEEAITRLWAAELESRIRRQLRGLSEGVGCEVCVQHGVGAASVLRTGEMAQLLVLGRNASTADHRAHLGRTARTALRECACPVLLLAPA